MNLYFVGGYQNNSGIDIFHEKEPTSIGLISTSQICKRLLEDSTRRATTRHRQVRPTGLNPRPTGPWPLPLGSFLCKLLQPPPRMHPNPM
jgi:hypothetical protein